MKQSGALFLSLALLCAGYHQALGFSFTAIQPISPLALWKATTTAVSSTTSCSSSIRDDEDYAASSTSTSINFAMDATSEEAYDIIRKHLGLSAEQHQQLSKLAVLVNDWNNRVNLISRKDCSKEVVFGRHILPSLAPMIAFQDIDIDKCKRIVDVGTGGGFPGLPLAIAFPDIEFTLVDSVGKKLKVVEDVAKQLDLQNVKICHGRAESLSGNNFDICVGRSVAAIPTYCFWIQNLLRKKTGHLVYIIGGDIEPALMDQTLASNDIDSLLDRPGVSDKKVLVFPQTAVKQIASSSGEKINGLPRKRKITLGKKKQNQSSKGQWNRRDNSQPKQRGYEGFKRYDHLNPE